ncbi:MAG: hypothetical protein HKM05_01505 [Spirochaetales bacterium]|nr:hypothetical protein [Spirochaetales bacterium]
MASAPASPDGGFVGALFRALGLTDEQGMKAHLPPFHLTLDSSAFFTPEGRKLGLGSSAALAVVVTAAARLLQGQEVSVTTVMPQAIQAHRMAQGGKGSGYDVATSCWGGIGLFTGGDTPQWMPATWRLPPAWLFSGPEAVKTVSAIGQYQAWKSYFPQKAHEFVLQSNQAVQRFFMAETWLERRQRWEEYKQLSLELGRQLGVSADLATSLPPQYFVKALGAGNETGLILAETGLILGESRDELGKAPGTDRTGLANPLGTRAVAWQVAEKGLSVD